MTHNRKGMMLMERIRQHVSTALVRRRASGRHSHAGAWERAGQTILLVLMFTLCAMNVHAQEPTVYASVLSSGLFIVGAANSNTGLFFQSPSEDTTWHHTGATRIRAFGMAAVKGTRGKTLYISSGNGVHKSTDGGQSWKITTSWKMNEIIWLAVDQNNENNLYAATPYGVFKSNDAAQSWNISSKGLEASLFVSSIIVNPRNPRILYCSTEDGAYRSLDEGWNWKRMALPVKGIRVIAQSPKDQDMLAAGTEDDGIFISRDRGETWSRSESGMKHSTFYTITFDPTNESTLYAGGFETGVYTSTDKGQTWKNTSEGLTNSDVHSIAVDPTNPKRIYCGTIWGGVFRSDDAGLHWKYTGLYGSQVWSVNVYGE